MFQKSPEIGRGHIPAQSGFGDCRDNVVL